jgi:hypothetical protein
MFCNGVSWKQRIGRFLCASWNVFALVELLLVSPKGYKSPVGGFFGAYDLYG